MQKPRKIMSPTDLSENSRTGLRFALSLAARDRVEPLVLHVARDFPLWSIPDEPGVMDADCLRWEVDRLASEASLDLSRFLEEHKKDFPRECLIRKKVVLGGVAEKIVRVACQEEVDLIVMSPRPHGPLRRLFSRSITDRVAREAPCPVPTVCPRRIGPHPGGERLPVFGLLHGART
jgi:nucleotide-binding universal stress UspA family protein